ncbi:hypothetical protein [Mesorhizobium waimense]|uniref:hypothetical protein n=1 Tax=Mesorhizobium waimense TaxID=1300307 RepID=UPI000E74E77A|nr:hypothetical protein [Mesorhizobium waimense]
MDVLPIYKLVQAVPSEIGKIIVGAVSRATGNPAPATVRKSGRPRSSYADSEGIARTVPI